MTLSEPTSSTMFTTVAVHVAKSGSRFNHYDVLLDNQATTAVFHSKSLLKNLRESSDSVNITGISDKVVNTNMIGEVEHYGTVWYSPEVPVNILPVSVIENHFDIEYNKKKNFTVYLKDGTVHVFKKVVVDPLTGGGLYVCNMDPRLLRRSHTICLSVADNEAKYSKREVASAKLARDVMRKLGYPSQRDMADMLTAGSLLDCPVTIQDVKRAQDIYGDVLAALQGKTKQKKAAAVQTSSIDVVRRDQDLHVDLMFIDREPYLVSVSSPLQLLMVNHCGDKSTDSVKAALLNHISLYKGQDYQVKMILCDGEGAVQAMRQDLNEIGIAVNIAGPQQHVPLVEVKIREIKERVRCHIAALPFRLPDVLTAHLVSFCVSTINMFPTRSSVNRLSPREQFLRRKIKYGVDVRVGFGEYAQCVIPNTNKNDVYQPRTDGCIALTSAENIQGSVKFFHIATRKLVTRNQFTVMPCPAEVIAAMNALPSHLPRGDLEFRIGNKLVEPRFESSQDEDPGQDGFMSDDDDPEDVYSVYSDDSHASSDVVSSDDEETPPPPEDQEQDDASEASESSADDSATDDTTSTVVSEDEEFDDIASSMITSEEPRYPQRVRAPKRLSEFDYETVAKRSRHTILHLFSQHVFNMSPNKAIKMFQDKAVSAINAELQQMIAKEVWWPVPPDQLSGKKVISSFMFLKEKFTASGDFDKLKARLVAGGNEQDRLAYDNIASPTVSSTSVFMVAAIAAREHRHVLAVDIGGAYLNADLEAEVYMSLDAKSSEILAKMDPSYEAYLTPKGRVIVKLRKALYGCVESALLWYQHLERTLVSIGFKKNPYDECVFNRGEGAEQCTICVYVDDLLITSRNPHMGEHVVQALKDVYKEVKVDNARVLSYLGMNLDFRIAGQVKISMDGYVQDTLSECKVKGRASSPAPIHLYEIRESAVALDEEKKKVFHSRVAKLLYLAKRARPDILQAVAFLATRVSCSTADDWSKLERCMKYINGTTSLGLILNPSSLSISAYVDAAYGVHSDRKSHTGAVICVGGSPVFAKSSKQTIVTKSSTEAELVGLSDMCSQVIWCRAFMVNQGYVMAPAKIYQDNMSTLAMAKNGKAVSERTRHIDIRYFFVKDRVDSGEVVLEHKPTEEMVADVLTKPLQGDTFKYLASKLVT